MAAATEKEKGGDQSSMSPLPSGFGTRPWLVQAARGGHRQTFVDSSDGTAHAVAVPELRGKTCLGCVHGGDWLLMLDESTAECFLLRLTPDDDPSSPTSKKTIIPLPPLREPLESIGTCATLGSPSHLREFTVVVAIADPPPIVDDDDDDDEEELEQSSSILFHCRPGDAEWAVLDAAPAPWPSFPGLLITHKAQIYSYSVPSRKLAAISRDGADGTLRAWAIGTVGGWKKAHDRVPMHRLVESRGKLFAVATEQFGVHGREDGTPTRVAVYRLSLRDMEWKRVKGISADRAFVVSGNYAFSVEAGGEEGLVRQGNCVYLVASSCNCERLYKFCLDDMTVSFRKILSHPTEPWSRAFWAIPPHIQATEVKETESSSEEEYDESEEEDDESEEDEVSESICQSVKQEEEQASGTSWARHQPWQDVQLELLELVVSNLSLVDRLRFPAVCKSWKKVCNPVQEAKVWPWLMHSSGQDGKCKFFDPLRGQEYSLRVRPLDPVGADNNETDELYEHIFRSSKDGWVAVSTGACIDDIFLLNPFTEDTMEVAEFYRKYHFMGLSWTGTDNVYADRVFFGIGSSHSGDSVSIHTFRKYRDAGWTQRHFIEYHQDDAKFPVAYTIPVWFRGRFYCLGRTGNLGTFDPASNEWAVLEKPGPVNVLMHVLGDNHEGRDFCYLVELRGELVSVFVRNSDLPPRVFKLDEASMAWVEVQEIGGAALFVDFRASYAVASPEGGCGNRIYFPRYSEDGKRAAYYDMEARKYCPSFDGLKQPLQCVWVVPHLHRYD